MAGCTPSVEALETRRLLSDSIYITNTAANTVSEYDTSGNLINPSFISGLNAPMGIAVSGNDIFVVNNGSGTIGEYTTSGDTVNASLISGLRDPTYITVAGAALFVSSDILSSTTYNDYLGEYSTTGATATPQLVGGFAQVGGLAFFGTYLMAIDVGIQQTDGYNVTTPNYDGTLSYIFDLPVSTALVGSGSNLFTLNNNQITEYNTSGTAVNTASAAFAGTPAEVALDGSDLFAIQITPDLNNPNGDTVGEFTTGGSTVNSALIPNLTSAGGIAVSQAVDTSINQLAFVDQPASTSTGNLGQVTVDIEDANGNLVTSDNSNVTLSLFDNVSGARLNGSTSVTVAVVGGVATFNGISLSQTGTNYTLNALDGADVPTNSQAFDVTGTGGGGGGGGGGGTGTGSASALFVQQPSTAAAGAKMSSIEVTLESASGTAATTSKSKVTLSIVSGPSGGKIIGSTSQSPKGGTATFKSLKLEKAGTYTLEASASGFASADSSAITITGGAVKKAIFSAEPANVAPGTPFNVAVELTDAYGNEAGDGDTVTLALQSHPKGSALAGDLTATVSSGVADFDDLTLATAGDYSLKATAGKGKATSSKFIVS